MYLFHKLCGIQFSTKFVEHNIPLELGLPLVDEFHLKNFKKILSFHFFAIFFLCLETFCKLLTFVRQQINISTFFIPTGGSYRPLFNASSKVPGAAALLREASSTGTSARSKRQTSKSTCNQAKSLHSILTILFFCSKASKKMSSCVPTESLDYE